VRSKRVLRHYCDHCRYSGGNKAAAEKHEKRCFVNPTRECPLCDFASLVQEPIQDLIGALSAGGVDLVRQKASGCPACIVSAILQDRKQRDITKIAQIDGVEEPWYEFNYGAERERFMHRVYEERGDY
jgi:hypothetical protein